MQHLLQHNDTDDEMITRANRGRWLLLIHQLPARPSNLRVTIWRRLQQLGAVALRNSVYVLPNTPETQEDFEWLRTEIVGLGGSATVMATDVVDSHGAGQLVEQFRARSRRDYGDLTVRIQKLLKRRRDGRWPAARREAQAMREAYSRILSRDYFKADHGGRAAALVLKLEASASDGRDPTAPRTSRKLSPVGNFRGKTWVTRTRPGIDRMACAWFIRKFVDPKARFSFVPSGAQIPPRAVPFDMYGVEFGHQNSHCTFETFIERFAIADAATIRLSQVVHDLDMKDDRHGLPECAAVGRLVEGLRQLYSDDDELLTHGMILMEALHRSFAGEQPRKKTRK